MLTAEQKRIRRNYLCASDIAPIFGLSHFKKGGDVFFDKRPDLLGIDAATLDAQDSSTPAMEAGNHLEHFILLKAAEDRGSSIKIEQEWCIAEDGICAATLDARLEDDRLLEAKTAGLARMFGDRLTKAVKSVRDLSTYNAFCQGIDSQTDWYAPEFGDGIADIPDAYFLQVQAQMYCAESSVVIVPACVAGRGHKEYVIERDDETIGYIKIASENFMRHVKDGVLPDGCMASIDLLKLRKREPGKIITFGDDKIALYTEYHRLKLEADDLAKLADDAKSAIIAELGDAEIGQFSNGAKITFKEQAANRIDTALLKKEYPEVAASVTKTTVSRVARITEPKVKEN